MPKMKSHRGACKRFSRTGSGKVKYKHNNLRHNLGNQDRVAKKRLMKCGILKACDARRVVLMLAGSGR